MPPGVNKIGESESARQQPAGAQAVLPAEPRPDASSTQPLCLVVDEERSVCQFISLILHGLGVDTIELPDGAALRTIRAPRAPDLIFHSVSLESTEVIESLIRLSRCNYGGHVQLMSRRGAAVLEHVKKVGVEHKLKMLPPLKKPFGGDVIVKIMQDLKLGLSVIGAARDVKLDEALSRNWIEFWQQPVIDLRRKRLVGAEMYARVRHPEAGVILPAGFIGGASPEATLKLAELSVTSALKVGANYSKLGIGLPITINIPLDALEKLPLEKLILDFHSHATNWPGLNIDIAEEQVISNLGLATELANKLARVKVRIAIDNFGKSYSSLTGLKELPFTLIKLDRAFTTNCGTDNVKAPLCKTMVDLAHNFGQLAVAMGIESASDASALLSMGCDYGQGFLLGQPMPQAHFMSLIQQRGLKSKDHKPNAAAA